VRFFLQCAFAQEILHVFFASEGTVALITKRGFMFFFRSFHPTDRDFGPERTIQPALQSPAQRVWNCGNRFAHVR
jgi:hypothetical protein